MQTMHLTLPVGAFDWVDNPLTEAEFRSRIDVLRNVMKKNNWGGIAVFGEIHECGLLTYYSNYAPRLSPAMALIPTEGEPRILTLVGGRMVPAGKLTTWMEDVQAAGNLSETLGAWLQETAKINPVALAGFDLMQTSDYDKISSLTEIVQAPDATTTLNELVRQKSPAELNIIKQNCEILSAVSSALQDNKNNGASPASCAVIAEKTARNLNAQDARCLYSPDGGNTFLPFEKLSDAQAEPFVFYVAVKTRGYWSDGFITLRNQTSETYLAAENALIDMIAAVKPGVSAKQLTTTQESQTVGYSVHPILLNSLGAGIGVSLEEEPRLTFNGDAVIAEGEILSLKAGLQNNTGEAAIVSALLKVQANGTEILWKSI